MSKFESWVYSHASGIELANALLLILLEALGRVSERTGIPLAPLTVCCGVIIAVWGVLLPVIGIRQIRKNQAVSEQETRRELQDFLRLVVLPPLMAIGAILC